MPDTDCGDVKQPLSLARLKKKTKVEARWQFRVGIPDGVMPSNFPKAALGAVAVAIDDDKPIFERTKALDIGVPTVDSDGALEIGMFYTRAVPGGETLKSLGGVPKTAANYGVEYVPRSGDDASKTFRERFEATTHWRPTEASPCDDLAPDGLIQERINEGYQNFYSGVTVNGLDLLDPGVVPRGAALHAYPHKLDRGSPIPTIFATSRIEDSKALAAAVTPVSLDKLKSSRGLSVLHTSMEDWVAEAENGWAAIPTSRGAMLLLARYRNERRLAVGPVRDIVGHVAAMQLVDVEELPDGWVRVRNLSGHDLTGVTIELPTGSSALFPRGSRATTEETMVFFDLLARGEQVFRVTDAKSWLQPAKISVASGE
jgi:hypothetical protein